MDTTTADRSRWITGCDKGGTEGNTFVTPNSGSQKSRKHCCRENADVVDNVEAAEERDRHLESGQVFPSSYSWWNQRWIVSLAGPL